MTPDVVETAAQVLHDRRHRAGTGQVCGGCRADAQAVAEVLLDGEAWARLQGIEQRAQAMCDEYGAAGVTARAIVAGDGQ